MLVRLFGRNFRSFKTNFELSMVAADLKRKEDRDRGVVEVPIAGAAEPLRLLRSVAIYGANASGKSTLLLAARALNWLVAESSAKSKPSEKIPPYEPFLLDDVSRVAPVELGCDVVHEQSLLRYEIKLEEKSVLCETLTLFDENGETRLIDRKPSGEVGGDLISHGEVNRLYVKEMQPNVAVLSKLAQHGPRRGPESVQPYYAAIRDATQPRDYSNATTYQIKIGDVGRERFADDPNYREWIMRHLIRSADVGISGVETRRVKFTIPDFARELLAKPGDGQGLPDEGVVVSFVHEGISSQAIDSSANASVESSGTRKLFNLAADWWRWPTTLSPFSRMNSVRASIPDYSTA